MASVQRLMLYLTPVFILDILCRVCPRTVIGLLCHWINEKNPDLAERRLATRRINPLPVAKKVSKLSTLSILNLLRQDQDLWKFYISNQEGGKIISLKNLPYILLELMYDLGGQEGRDKVREIVQKSRTIIGSSIQGDILENFKVETVLDIFEDFEKHNQMMEIKTRLSFSNEQAVAFWLTHWDMRMQQLDQSPKSAYWLGQLPGARAYKIEDLMNKLELRRKYEILG